MRVGPAGYDQALAQLHTRLFDMIGRLMTDWIMVEPPGIASQADLRRWIELGVKYGLTLPPK